MEHKSGSLSPRLAEAFVMQAHFRVDAAVARREVPIPGFGHQSSKQFRRLWADTEQSEEISSISIFILYELLLLVVTGLLTRFREAGSRQKAVAAATTVAEHVLPRPYERWAVLANDELTTQSPPVSHTERFWLYRHGFRSRAAHLYDFETYNPEDYLSDVARYVHAYYLNGAWLEAIDNKLLCHILLNEFDEHLPTVYGLLKGGQLHPIDESDLPRSDDGSVGRLLGQSADFGSSVTNGTDWFVECLQSEGRLVCKRFKGGSGKQVLICTWNDEGYTINGESCSEAELRSQIDNVEGYLVTEYIKQAAYAADLYPDSINTMRVLTMYDEAAGEPFVPIATHRLGTARSGALDNFSQGGLSVGVDRESGKLGPGVQYLPPEPPKRFEIHPETGEPIAGVEVPGWDRIKAELLRIADRISYIPYIGWDIVVTDEGEFMIIEANNNSSAVIQIHKPLLRDERTRRFYERHDVI